MTRPSTLDNQVDARGHHFEPVEDDTDNEKTYEPGLTDPRGLGAGSAKNMVGRALSAPWAFWPNLVDPPYQNSAFGRRSSVSPILFGVSMLYSWYGPADHSKGFISSL